MQSKKKPNRKTPNKNTPFGEFKMYWIYGIIAVIFLGIQFTSVNTTKYITETDFLNKVVNNYE